MDPTECYDLMAAAFNTGDTAAAAAHAEDLLSWLDRGGFAPVGVGRQEARDYAAMAVATHERRR